MLFLCCCQARLARWQEQQPEGQSSRPVVTVVVQGAEQIPAARAFVEFMYRQHLPQSATQQLLIDVLQLADEYDVQSCAVACCQHLSAMQLEWNTVLRVLWLPPACSESEVFGGLFSSASEQLQQQLGDLEVAWASDEGRQRFLALPLKGVQLLLSDDRTRVAYENTVLVATTMWLQQHSSSLTSEDKKRLAELIRLPHITPLFASSVLHSCHG